MLFIRTVFIGIPKTDIISNLHRFKTKYLIFNWVVKRKTEKIIIHNNTILLCTFNNNNNYIGIALISKLQRLLFSVVILYLLFNRVNIISLEIINNIQLRCIILYYINSLSCGPNG